jgi:hypothetical protein
MLATWSRFVTRNDATFSGRIDFYAFPLIVPKSTIVFCSAAAAAARCCQL